jgi:hypothetical protein
VTRLLLHLAHLAIILRAARRVAAATNDVDRFVATRILRTAIETFDAEGFGDDESALRLSLAVILGRDAA